MRVFLFALLGLEVDVEREGVLVERLNGESMGGKLRRLMEQLYGLSLYEHSHGCERNVGGERYYL